MSQFFTPEEIVVEAFVPASSAFARLHVLTGCVSSAIINTLTVGDTAPWMVSILETARWTYREQSKVVDQKTDEWQARALSMRAITCSLALLRLSKSLSLTYKFRQDCLDVAIGALDGARRNLETELEKG